MIKFLALSLLLLGLLVADVSTTQAKDTKSKESAVKASPLTVSLSKKADGPAMTEFGAGDASIFATYHGEKLTKGDKVKVVWTLEDGGKKYNPNYKLTEYTMVADAPDSKGFSQLNKPASGWPLGKYRADVYVNDAKVESLRFTIK